jgi:hypothetical protein
MIIAFSANYLEDEGGRVRLRTGWCLDLILHPCSTLSLGINGSESVQFKSVSFGYFAQEIILGPENFSEIKQRKMLCSTARNFQ